MKTIKKYLALVDRLVTDILRDLCSFRNKLVLITCVICFVALQTKDPTIVTAALGCWTIVLSYYFYSRNKSREMELRNYNEKRQADKISEN